MVHSFSEKSPRIVFHAQILSDFAMVEDIGRKMLVELAGDVPAQRRALAKRMAAQRGDGREDQIAIRELKCPSPTGGRTRERRLPKTP
jgi:hypothetical protein